MKKCASLLLLFLQIYRHVQCNFIYIRPQREYTICPFQPCQTMMEYVDSPSISSNATLAVLPGNHDLKAQLSIAGKINFTMVAFSDLSTTSIRCSGSGRLTLNTIQDAKIRGLPFIGCGGNTAESVDHLTLEDSHFTDGSLVDAAGAWMIIAHLPTTELQEHSRKGEQ